MYLDQSNGDFVNKKHRRVCAPHVDKKEINHIIYLKNRISTQHCPNGHLVEPQCLHAHQGASCTPFWGKCSFVVCGWHILGHEHAEDPSVFGFSDANVNAQYWAAFVTPTIGVCAPGDVLEAVAFDVPTANGGFILDLGLFGRGPDQGRAGRVCGRDEIIFLTSNLELLERSVGVGMQSEVLVQLLVHGLQETCVQKCVQNCGTQERMPRSLGTTHMHDRVASPTTKNKSNLVDRRTFSTRDNASARAIFSLVERL